MLIALSNYEDDADQKLPLHATTHAYIPRYLSATWKFIPGITYQTIYVDHHICLVSRKKLNYGFP